LFLGLQKANLGALWQRTEIASIRSDTCLNMTVGIVAIGNHSPTASVCGELAIVVMLEEELLLMAERANGISKPDQNLELVRGKDVH